jgi:hypothetical protein
MSFIAETPSYVSEKLGDELTWMRMKRTPVELAPFKSSHGK